MLRAAARVDGPAPAIRSASSATSATASKRRTRPQVHVVRRGESYWSIAQRNNIDVNTLMRLNGKRPGQTILPGERLVVANAATSGSRNNRAGRNNPVESGSVQRVITSGRASAASSSKSPDAWRKHRVRTSTTGVLPLWPGALPVASTAKRNMMEKRNMAGGGLGVNTIRFPPWPASGRKRCEIDGQTDCWMVMLDP